MTPAVVLSVDLASSCSVDGAVDDSDSVDGPGAVDDSAESVDGAVDDFAESVDGAVDDSDSFDGAVDDSVESIDGAVDDSDSVDGPGAVDDSVDGCMLGSSIVLTDSVISVFEFVGEENLIIVNRNTIWV